MCCCLTSNIIMRYARIYPWRRTRRSRAPSNGPEAFFVARFSAGYTTNMFGFDLRQGQVSFVEKGRMTHDTNFESQDAPTTRCNKRVKSKSTAGPAVAAPGS